MYCETYRATIPEKTCILRHLDLAGSKTQSDVNLGTPPYHKFGGCRDCQVGLDLYAKYKKGEFKLTMQTKKCTRCGKEKPLGDFYADASTPDKMNYWCKPCCKEASRASYQKSTRRKGMGIIEKQKENIHTLVLDFSARQDLFENIQKAASQEFRTPEMQVMYWLTNMEQALGA